MAKVKFELTEKGSSLQAEGSVKELAIATAHMTRSLYFKIMKYGPKNADRYKAFVRAFTADTAPTWNEDPASEGDCIGFDPEELRKQMEMGK